MEKTEIIKDLKTEFLRWRVFLESLSEEEGTKVLPGETLSIKDKVAHLHAWQQLSIARLEAATQNHDPLYPDWLRSAHPDTDDVDQENERIFQMYQGNSWQEVMNKWRTGFEYFIKLCKNLPDENIFIAGINTWLPDYALADVMLGSLEHHREHFDPLQKRGTISSI